MRTLTVDLGTTTIKCALFNDGKEEKYFAKEYGLVCQDTRIMQNSEDWKNIIKEGFSTFGDLSDVSGISISSQGITILPVDENGKPLTLADSWLDYTAEEEKQNVEKTFGKDKIFSLTGKNLIPCYSLFKIMRFVKSGVKAYKYLMPLDYIYFLLTGKYYTDYSMASGTMLFDIVKREYNDTLLNYCGIKKENLAEPVPMGTFLGYPSEEAQKFFGLSKNTAVIMGGQDQKMSAFSVGIKENTACVSIGTSTAINTFKFKEGFSTFAFDDDNLIHEYAISTTGAAIKWLKNLCFSCYDEINVEAEKAGSSNGVTFESDFTFSAGINGLKLGTTKGEIAYALYEDLARKITSTLSPEITEIILYGGGTKSKILCKIIEKISGRRITIPDKVKDTALAGANKCILKYYKGKEKLC